MKRIVSTLMFVSWVIATSASRAISRIRPNFLLLAVLMLAGLGVAPVEAAVGMPATPMEQKAISEVFFSLQMRGITGETAPSSQESKLPESNDQEKLGGNLDSARMLGGTWTMVETMGSSTFTDTYTFTSVATSPDSSGRYMAYGTNQYGNVVGAAYDQTLDVWALADPISSTSGYNSGFGFTFLDDNHVSGCYYFYPKTSSSLGTCYSFYGSRPAVYTPPTPTNQTISFGAAPAVSVGGTGQLSATASSGLAVTFISATSSVCTVSGSIVTGVAAGTCTIRANQAGNASYYAAPQVTQNVTVSASAAPGPIAGVYDGIYQWAPGYFLSLQQIGGGTLIGAIYWVYTGNSVPIGNRTISEVDTFDLLHGQLVGSNAAMDGTGFYRGCNLSYNFTFNSGSSITVHHNSVSNSAGVSATDVNCAAKFNTVGSNWTIPRVY